MPKRMIRKKLFSEFLSYKMKLISHRGNTAGPKADMENNPAYIDSALKQGYEVEIDVWHTINGWFLGHDCPQYSIQVDYLKNDRLWCHAKNLEALQLMLEEEIHCFWHQEDDHTLTSRGIIWTYPNKSLTASSVCVNINKRDDNFENNLFGVCSDWISTYLEDYSK